MVGLTAGYRGDRRRRSPYRFFPDIQVMDLRQYHRLNTNRLIPTFFFLKQLLLHAQAEIKRSHRPQLISRRESLGEKNNARIKKTVQDSFLKGRQGNYQTLNSVTVVHLNLKQIDFWKLRIWYQLPGNVPPVFPRGQQKERTPARLLTKTQ